LYSSQNIKAIKIINMRPAKHVARMEEMRNGYEISVRKHDGMNH